MWNSSLPLLAGLVGLAIAAGPGRASAFSVRFSWAGIPACERISPQLHLAGVPAGTKKLRCEMQDLDVPSFRHGGATVAYDGDNVKKGAIHYIGPCPPHGEHHRYRWTVQALDAAGKVLGTATATETFPP
jgi:phosphatidylethanolamine-binding protein (PEBP) family uncharacterized protein